MYNLDIIKKSNKTIKIIQYVLIIIFAIPIVLYFYKFHGSLSNDFNIWAAFGSYLSGIYSFLFSFVTLRIIGIQVLLQKEQKIYEENQNYLNNTRDVIEFFTDNLKVLLQTNLQINNPIFNDRLMYLSNIFGRNIQDITINELFIILKYMQDYNDNINHEILFSILKIEFTIIQINHAWATICIRLEDLYRNKNIKYYSLEYSTNVAKIQTILSLNTCIALDNYQKLINSKLSHYAFLDWEKYQ